MLVPGGLLCAASSFQKFPLNDAANQPVDAKGVLFRLFRENESTRGCDGCPEGTNDASPRGLEFGGALDGELAAFEDWQEGRGREFSVGADERGRLDGKGGRECNGIDEGSLCHAGIDPCKIDPRNAPNDGQDEFWRALEAG